MARVLVLAGGTSDEREVSLRSGNAVVSALTDAGHSVTQADPADGLEALRTKLEGVDVVFPALHGAGGEDGVIQAWLESHQVAFVGAGSQASALCFDKWRFKEAMSKTDIQMPAGELVDKDSLWQSVLTIAPFVLKPYDGGSSIDTFIVHVPSEAPRQAITEAFSRHQKMLLEPLVAGREITVGVLGDVALPVIEIIPPADKEFDYENKYNGLTQELCPPKTISQAAQKQAQALALEAHEAAGCRHLSRSDFIVTDDDELYLLETNTLPGMTEASLLPKAAAAYGLSMPQLCDKLVQLALAE
jgi:D-alanine-D-alanine ligase